MQVKHITKATNKQTKQKRHARQSEDQEKKKKQTKKIKDYIINIYIIIDGEKFKKIYIKKLVYTYI